MSDSYKRNLAVPFFTQRDNTYIWTKKAEAYFTYVPGKKISNNELADEELLLCGTWRPVYLSPHFYEIAEPYKNQYVNADSKGNVFFVETELAI